MKIDFSLGKCKTKAAYSSKLIKQGKLNLKKIKNRFNTILRCPLSISKSGIKPLVSTPLPSFTYLLRCERKVPSLKLNSLRISSTRLPD